MCTYKYNGPPNTELGIQLTRHRHTPRIVGNLWPPSTPGMADVARRKIRGRGGRDIPLSHCCHVSGRSYWKGGDCDGGGGDVRVRYE
ncbi:hypothetical protein E2C01_078601 [Portunus trituberculatus]|uniref:Uncharacterized protein n=1 Tax=Portunus trituberculatus TaxID=210409 RepID=A0A5B7IHC2_PORTR|nr:hypothetical protein [Portunus trituberculatus]